MQEPGRARPFKIQRGPTSCLLLHGLTGTPYEMRALGEALAAADVTVYCPLLPGHGTCPEDLAETGWRDWEASAIEAFEDLNSNASQLFVCGLSMGASLAIRIAARREVAGLIALSPAIRLQSRLVPFLPILSRLIPFRKKSSDIKDPVAKSVQPSYDRQSLAAANSLRDLLTRLPDDIRAMRAPLLVIVSRDDHVIDPEAAKRLLQEAGSDQKRIVMLEDSYHVITVDRESERVRREVVGFVQEVAGM